MDYSIVIPVFNREDLTKNCLATLLPTLEGAGDGEIIVVDNGSRPETTEVLRAFPWVRVIRNEKNLGFAAACNQGARVAAGRYVCHLNNDTVGQPRWLANMLSRCDPTVGIVGSQLLFPDDTLQHAGVVTYPVRFGPEGIGPYHIYWQWPRSTPSAGEPADFAIVTGACLLTPRELFLELDGFDEIFWNGYEDVDYCLRVRERGLRVVYEPSAILYHYESQSGVQRKRRLMHNLKTLGARWGAHIVPDHNRYWARNGLIRREQLVDGQQTLRALRVPPTTIIVHGDALADSNAFIARLRDTRIKAERIVWLVAGAVPYGCERSTAGVSPVPAVAALLRDRSDRYFAFVDTATSLRPGWLDDLVNAIEFGNEVVMATCVAEAKVAQLEPCAGDARCSLLNLRQLPSHVKIGAVETIDGALVDLSWQAVQYGLGVHAVHLRGVTLGPARNDAAFCDRFGIAHDEWRRPNLDRMEFACSDRPAVATLASIVMLSWNAPQYTKLAVESIQAHTHSPYEIIIVDNGSEPETRAILGGLANVRLIFNAENEGFARGCNQGMAAALGTHVVLLNNDVIVTEGWLESLLDAHRRDPLVGVSAPRSNRIVGHQQLDRVSYNSIEGIQAFAAERAVEYAGVHYRTNRAIGFCLCISRAVIDEVGGIDTRYGIGNFEDDDFCIRVRAAGYQIAVCEDAFIHHFGSVSFTANKVDYSSQMERNWRIFAQRWKLPPEYPTQGYDAEPAIARGFVRERDFVALPPVADGDSDGVREPRRSYATAFVAVVDGDSAWSRVGPVVTNYVKSLCVDDSTLFAIGVGGAADAVTIGGRIARSISKLKLDEGRVADIDVTDVDMSKLEQWIAAIPAQSCLRVDKDGRLGDLILAADRSPSGLLRTVRGATR